MRALNSVVFVVSAVAACGGGEGGGSPQAAVERSLSQTCAKAHDCRDSFPVDQGFMFEALFGNTEAECQTNFRELFDPAEVQASVDAGRVIYDAGDADVCLDAQAGVTCDQFWGIDESFVSPPECDTAFIGTVADGDACTISLDCAGGDNSSCNEETLVCEPDA